MQCYDIATLILTFSIEKGVLLAMEKPAAIFKKFTRNAKHSMCQKRLKKVAQLV